MVYQKHFQFYSHFKIAVICISDNGISINIFENCGNVGETGFFLC